jgi:hypothetical protein
MDGVGSPTQEVRVALGTGRVHAWDVMNVSDGTVANTSVGSPYRALSWMDELMFRVAQFISWGVSGWANHSAVASVAIGVLCTPAPGLPHLLFVKPVWFERSWARSSRRCMVSHLSLLMLECMQLIDQANAWSPSTHCNYQASCGGLSGFTVCPCLVQWRCSTPCHPSIGVMWAQQQYVLQTPMTNHTQSEEQIRFGTTRALCSAASQF